MLQASRSLHHLLWAGGALVRGPSGDSLPPGWQLVALATHAAAGSRQKARSYSLASPVPLPSAVLLPLQKQHSCVAALTLFPNNSGQASE